MSATQQDNITELITMFLGASTFIYPRLIALKYTKGFEYKLYFGSTHIGFVKWDKSSSFYLDLTPIPDTVRVRDLDEFSNPYYVIPNNWVNLSRIFPSDGKHIMDNYYLIFCIEKEFIGTDGTIQKSIKGAIKHRSLDQVVLLTGTNKVPTKAYYNSIAEGWYSFKSGMIAPPLFWDLLRASI